jgi:hypothetical protein
MLTMPIFQYLTFVCEQTELQPLLTRYGQEGWRLHTCDPVVTVGPQGSGLLNAFVVMDRYVEGPEPEEPATNDDAQEGIAMRG